MYVFDVFLVYTPVKVKFLISQPVRCSQALRMQWWLQVCHQENQERQSIRIKSPIIIRTIWNRLEALISSSTGGSGANIWFLEGKRYFDRLVFKNEMTQAFSGAGVPENRTKIFPMQEFQQHHSNNQMQGQRGCIQIFLSALKKWWAMMLCSMLEGTNRRSAARLHPGQLDRRRQFRLNHSSGFQFCTKGQSFTPKSHVRMWGLVSKYVWSSGLVSNSSQKPVKREKVKWIEQIVFFGLKSKAQ